ncbi:MAG: hypothetical protein WCP20_23235 [Desulfuromonadales bacterium]
MKKHSTDWYHATIRTGVFLLIPVIFPSLACAVSTTVNFSFPNARSETAVIVAPDKITTSTRQVYTTVQSNTELTTVILAAPAAAVPDKPASSDSAAPQPGDKQSKSTDTKPKRIPLGIGLESTFIDDRQSFIIPLQLTIAHDLYVDFIIPILTARRMDSDGEARSKTGVGDMSLTVKHRWGDEKSIELFSLLTVKLGSGEAEKGLGTGSYDISVTEKVIHRFGSYRLSMMGGVTQPLNRANIYGNKVEYGTLISYMGGVEREFFLPELWFGLRTAGLSVFETRIDGVSQNNSLTTLDVIPEIRYYTATHTALQLSVTVPAYTRYSLPGGTNNRDIAYSFGTYQAF